MRRGRRILERIWRASVAVSAGIYMAALVFWGRSYCRDDMIVYSAFPMVIVVNSETGSLQFQRSVYGFTSDLPDGWGVMSRPISDLRLFPARSTGGFAYEFTPSVTYGGIRPWSLSPMQFSTTNSVMVPYWFIIMLATPIPLVAIRRSLKRRRTEREGLCRACGYDLRASERRCPECGTTFNVLPGVIPPTPPIKDIGSRSVI